MSSKETRLGDLNKVLEPNASTKALNDALRPMQDIMKSLSNNVTFGEGSALSNVAKLIADHQKTLDASDISTISSARQLYDHNLRLQNIKNPVEETNKRLVNIEAHFDKMHQISTEQAKIANGLYAATTEFLAEFKEAAFSNDRSSKRAIRISFWAIIIAVLTTVAQIGYSEWGARKEARQAQVIMLEILNLEKQQNQNLQDLVEKLEKSHNSTLDVLTDIKTILVKQGEQKKVLSSVKDNK